MKKNINYDNYIAKHCARFYGWLPSSKEYFEKKKKNPLKYFTLSAIQAIDVFMFELEQLLLRDKNRKLPNVVICECLEDVAVDIIKLVRPPYANDVLVGKIEDILTFVETNETRNLPSDVDVPDKRIRQLLRMRNLQQRLTNHAPFDIINFDPYESLLDKRLADNKLYHALKKFFDLQEKTDNFLLFVTTKITDIHPEVEKKFKDDINSNASEVSQINKALVENLGTNLYEQIEDDKKRAIGFAKAIIIDIAKDKNWQCEHHGIFIYEYKRDDGKIVKMMNLVVRLFKSNDEATQNIYVKDIIKIIKDMPKFFSHQNADKDLKVKRHLNKVKKYREEIRNEFLNDFDN